MNQKTNNLTECLSSVSIEIGKNYRVVKVDIHFSDLLITIDTNVEKE